MPHCREPSAIGRKRHRPDVLERQQLGLFGAGLLSIRERDAGFKSANRQKTAVRREHDRHRIVLVIGEFLQAPIVLLVAHGDPSLRVCRRDQRAVRRDRQRVRPTTIFAFG